MERRKKASTKLSVNVVKKKKIAKDIKEKKIVEHKNTIPKEEGFSYEKVEREKRMIMWSGVTFFMILVMIFWVYNIKQVFVATTIESKTSETGLSDWKEITEEISSQVGEIKNVISDFKEIDNNEIANEENVNEEGTSTEKQLSTLPVSDDADLVLGTSTLDVAGTSTDSGLE